MSTQVVESPTKTHTKEIWKKTYQSKLVDSQLILSSGIKGIGLSDGDLT